MHILRILQLEVARQCAFGITAWQDILVAVERSDDDRVWYSVQALLVAAGNVSKLLWPSKETLPDRGRALRESLKVAEDLPLRPRDFRNHFEHFDERIELWAEAAPDGAFVDSCISNRPLPSVLSVGDPTLWLRNLDTGSWTVTFRGDSYDLSRLQIALRDLYTVAIVEAFKRDHVNA
jgi:hypothetical protein